MRNRKTLLASIFGAAAVVLAIAGSALAVDPSSAPSDSPAATASSDAAGIPTPTPEPTSAAPESTATSTPPADVAPVAPQEVKASPEAAETPDVEPAPVTLEGVLTSGTDADGDVAYFIGTTRLGVGPPWFWGDKNPLAPYVGATVTLTGHMDEGKPASTNPNGKVKPAEGPEFEVYTVNGTAVRSPGKPPWAGGPKVVGERHPGYKGWSQGQAEKDKAPKP